MLLLCVVPGLFAGTNFYVLRIRALMCICEVKNDANLPTDRMKRYHQRIRRTGIVGKALLSHMNPDVELK